MTTNEPFDQSQTEPPREAPDLPDVKEPDTARSTWTASEWRGKMVLDREGERLGKLQDVYVDVETDEPRFGTVKEGLLARHLTFVPLSGLQIGPDYVRVVATKAQVRSAPDLARGDELSRTEESALYHHFEINYTPPDTESGRRLARR